MIAFAAAVGKRETFERCAHHGLALHADPDSPIAEIETNSIFEGYNEALDFFGACADLEALVLLHEDVAIEDPEFCTKVRARVADPSIAIIGPIGATQVRSLCWWEGEMFGLVRETRGLIGHASGFRDVEVVDGLLMVLSPWAVQNLRFDAERFHGFHGYDVDLCFQARAQGRRVVVDDLTVAHHALGGVRNAADFWRADATLRHKWAGLGRDMASDREMQSVVRSL